MKRLFTRGNPYMFDYTLPFVPESVKKLKPIILVDTATKISYCCVYEKNEQPVIYGWGATPIEAMQEWDKEYDYKIAKGLINS